MEINNVEHLDKFKDIEGIKEIIDEIKEIEKYQRTKENNNAQEFLNKISLKYYKDKVEYNALNPHIAKTLEENLINAKKFLYYKASKIIVEKTNGMLKNEK